MTLCQATIAFQSQRPLAIMDDTMSRLSVHLLQLREAAELSQRQVADAIGVPHNFLSRWERDKNVPQRGYVMMLAGVYGAEQADLLALRDEAERERKAEKKAMETALGEAADPVDPPPGESGQPRTLDRKPRGSSVRAGRTT